MIKEWIEEYDPQNEEEIVSALREIMQEITLAALSRTDFFEKADFNNEDFAMSMLYIVILSAFGTALAKVLFNKLVQMATPVFASSVTYSMPLVALMWGILDGENFSVLQALATILILLGIYLANKRN